MFAHLVRPLMRPLGQQLQPIRPGLGQLAGSKLAGWVPMTVSVSSPAFVDGAPMPVRCTQDGDSVFPALRWDNLPDNTASLALMVEDADVPFTRPLVHAIVFDIDPALGGLDEGEVPLRLPGVSARGFRCGRNSIARPGWMAPSPPPGHGPHRYAFQVFALRGKPIFTYPPGRSLLLRTIHAHLLAQGRLIGTYERT